MGYDNFDKFVTYGRQYQIKDENDVFVGVTGPKGSGKTNFGLSYSRVYTKKYFNENYYQVKKYMAFDTDEVYEKMHTLPKYSPIVGDEGIRFAWSREWNKSDNRELTKLAVQIRPKKHILLLNIPKLVWIDKPYREGMLDQWIWLHPVIEPEGKSVYAMLFEPDTNQGEADSWHLKKLRQTDGKVRRIGKNTDIERIYNIVKKHPCFVDMFKVPKISDEIYQRYLEIRERKVMEKDSQYVNQKEVASVAFFNLMNHYDRFKKAIDQSRFKKPTQDIIAKTLCLDPSKGNKQMVTHGAIRLWIEQVKKCLPESYYNANNQANGPNQEEIRDPNGESNQIGSISQP